MKEIMRNEEKVLIEMTPKEAIEIQVNKERVAVLDRVIDVILPEAAEPKKLVAKKKTQPARRKKATKTNAAVKKSGVRKPGAKHHRNARKGGWAEMVRETLEREGRPMTAAELVEANPNHPKVKGDPKKAAYRLGVCLAGFKWCERTAPGVFKLKGQKDTPAQEASVKYHACGNPECGLMIPITMTYCPQCQKTLDGLSRVEKLRKINIWQERASGLAF